MDETASLIERIESISRDLISEIEFLCPDDNDRAKAIIKIREATLLVKKSMLSDSHGMSKEYCTLEVFRAQGII